MAVGQTSDNTNNNCIFHFRDPGSNGGCRAWWLQLILLGGMSIEKMRWRPVHCRELRLKSSLWIGVYITTATNNPFGLVQISMHGANHPLTLSYCHGQNCLLLDGWTENRISCRRNFAWISTSKSWSSSKITWNIEFPSAIDGSIHH